MRQHIFPFLVCMAALLAACTSTSPSSKKALHFNLFTEPPSLDPRKAIDSTSMNILLAVFDGLMRIDENQRPELSLAKSLHISDDAKTYTFKIREAYWSNGDRLTSHDFIYSWQSMLSPTFPSLFAYKLYVIKNAEKIKSGQLPPEQLGVNILDDETLEIILEHPTPYFLELLAFPTFFPINSNIDQSNPDWALEAGPSYVSIGPFRLKTWDHESEIVLEKNPSYWDAKVVQLDEISFVMIGDTMTELYMYEMGELDWAGSPLSNLSPDSLPTLIQEGSVILLPALAVYYYKLNTQIHPLNNRNMRRALALAINRNEIVEHITQMKQKPALSLVPPMIGWDSSPLYEDGDQKKAQELFSLALEELNLKQDELPELVLSYNTNREHQVIAQAIQQQWSHVLGIKVTLEQADWKVHLSNMNKQNYQIGRTAWVGDFSDPISFLEPFRYPDDPQFGGNNETGWSNPKYTEYMDAADDEIDPAKRFKLLKQAESILIDEMPIIPLYFINLCYLKKPYVKGAYMSPLGFIEFKKAYLESSRD